MLEKGYSSTPRFLGYLCICINYSHRRTRFSSVFSHSCQSSSVNVKHVMALITSRWCLISVPLPRQGSATVWVFFYFNESFTGLPAVGPLPTACDTGKWIYRVHLTTRVRSTATDSSINHPDWPPTGQEDAWDRYALGKSVTRCQHPQYQHQCSAHEYTRVFLEGQNP